jgi:hypothetical protein
MAGLFSTCARFSLGRMTNIEYSILYSEQIDERKRTVPNVTVLPVGLVLCVGSLVDLTKITQLADSLL